MTNVNVLDYDRIALENFRNVVARKELHRSLKEAIKDKGSVIVLESPAEEYAEANISSIEYLLKNGYEGVYLSFQRPYNNICSIFTKNKIDIKKLFIIDGATGFSGVKQKSHPRCVNIAVGSGIEKIVKAINTSLAKLKSKKRFVFVDSLSTMALHETLSETSRFSEVLIKTLKDKKFQDVRLLFNVAEQLTQRTYIENVSVYADQHLHLGLCT